MTGLTLPWLPPGRLVPLPGRGEVFVRQHVHPDPSRPTLLLLHGWTASADLQFFTAYEELAASWSFVAVDHRGHGRGLRDPRPYQLEDAADDAAGVVRALGVGPVITVGYSMGGPISLFVAKRHPDVVAGMVTEATAMHFSLDRMERMRWALLPLMGPLLRSAAYPRLLRIGVRKLTKRDHPLLPYADWMAAEYHRGEVRTIVQAGRALRRYDARPWAGGLGKPAAAVITTADRLVFPRQQEALAAALGAQRVELVGDHIAPWADPAGFSAATAAAVRAVEAMLIDQATSSSSIAS